MIPINAFNIVQETLNQTTVYQSFHAVIAAGDFYYAYCFLLILSALARMKNQDLKNCSSSSSFFCCRIILLHSCQKYSFQKKKNNSTRFQFIMSNAFSPIHLIFVDYLIRVKEAHWRLKVTKKEDTIRGKVSKWKKQNRKFIRKAGEGDKKFMVEQHYFSFP